MTELDAVINGIAQGAGMVGVFALYLNSRLDRIEKAIDRLADRMTVLLQPPKGGTIAGGAT